jgi:hypothetical protein
MLAFCSSCTVYREDKAQEKNKTLLQPVCLNAHVDKVSVTVGDVVTFTLTLNHDPALSVNLPEAGSLITGLRIIEAGEEGPRLIDDRMVHTKWYKLQPDLVGSYVIPPVKLSYTDQRGELKELQSPQIFIAVKSGLQDKPAGASADIIDIKPIQEIPRPLLRVVLYGAVVVFLFLVAGTVFWLSRRRRRHRAAAPPKPAHQLALEELEALNRDQLIEKGVIREYYFRLSEIFRRYIERRFHIPAVERTTEELVPDIISSQEFSSAIKAEMRDILRFADLVKFARLCPDKNTTDTEYRKIMRVIEETKEGASAPATAGTTTNYSTPPSAN